MKRILKPRKLPAVQRFPSEAARTELISDIEDKTKHLMRLVAKSKEDTATKESLADFLLFILNVVDIENAKISYEKIKSKKKAGSTRPVSKT